MQMEGNRLPEKAQKNMKNMKNSEEVRKGPKGSESLPRKCLDLGSDGVILDFRESALLLGSHVSCVGQVRRGWATWDGSAAGEPVNWFEHV